MRTLLHVTVWFQVLAGNHYIFRALNMSYTQVNKHEYKTISFHLVIPCEYHFGYSFIMTVFSGIIFLSPYSYVSCSTPCIYINMRIWYCIIATLRSTVLKYLPLCSNKTETYISNTSVALTEWNGDHKVEFYYNYCGRMWQNQVLN
jgi:hypothetical protein